MFGRSRDPAKIASGKLLDSGVVEDAADVALCGTPGKKDSSITCLSESFYSCTCPPFIFISAPYPWLLIIVPLCPWPCSLCFHLR